MTETGRLPREPEMQDLRCTHCGRLRSNSEAYGSDFCAPPFERRLHDFSGNHPADKR